MPLYEHVFIARQDLSSAQAEGLIEHFATVVADNGGSITEREYWGVKTMAYKINKNRKGHYAFLKSNAPSAAIQEMERLMGLHDDVMRVLTIKVDAHVEGPSVQMQKRDERDRGDRPEGGFGGGERRERSFGDRPDRGGDRGGFGGERSGGGGFGGDRGGERSGGGGFGGGDRSSAPPRR